MPDVCALEKSWLNRNELTFSGDKGKMGYCCTFPRTLDVRFGN